jgi:type II restriction/modification system DNA methylase subunit YeeA
MPFLFEGIDDETELVLPENLLHSDSIIRKLVAASAPEDWQEVEVLGWLYQYYISERKDEVMGRKSAVPTEDIPAVTQLFTPHWIVRYLVENSLGRLWLLNRPGSRLREHMPYYIEGEAETDYLRIDKPEDIRLLDPACGSGHMLTYAFDLLFLIYTEEGYVPDEIPALILRHNLYGLEICPRAAQIANLALVFKAREKSRRFMKPGNLVQPHILALQNIHFGDGELRDYIARLDLGDLFNEPMIRLLHQFEEATTFGSLIQPCFDEAGIAYARQAIDTKHLGSHLFLPEIHRKVLCVLKQAELLSQRYHVVVANPPYMGSKGMSPQLKCFLEANYPTAKADLFAAFIKRNLIQGVQHGRLGFVTPYVWMFISTYEPLRKQLLGQATITSLTQLEYNAFEPACIPVCCFTLSNYCDKFYRGTYIKLSDFRGANNQAPKTLEAIANPNCSWRYHASAHDFGRLPGNPISYWASKKTLDIFEATPRMEEIVEARQGLATADNGRFLRIWAEVSFDKIGLNLASREAALASNRKWFPYNKGGEFRKWYGNQEYLVNWESDGHEIAAFRPKSVIRNPGYYFKESVSWSDVTSSANAFRWYPSGFIFDSTGHSAFPNARCTRGQLLCLLNNKFIQEAVQLLNPTMHFHVGYFNDLPAALHTQDLAGSLARPLIELARADWDNFETSWNFHDLPLLRPELKGTTLAASWQNWQAQCTTAIHQMQELETENNRLFIEAYGLADELTPEVTEDQITLARADARKDMAAFLSYAVGCNVGRYSLDKPGLILANASDSLAEYLEKVGKPLDALTFAPAEDGIIPVLDGEWFKDDVVARTRNFLRTTFGEATLEANLRFIEESVDKDLRKYFLTDFYKDHLQTYKKRPIYWLFSSGQERAFQALVYLHRYHEGTLSRMRTEYVIPLQGKITSRIDQLKDDAQKAVSTSHRKKMDKERDALLKQRTELQAFDEKLRHYADQRVQLDLDDGVKVNYGKFGDLLAEVKAVTGGNDE